MSTPVVRGVAGRPGHAGTTTTKREATTRDNVDNAVCQLGPGTHAAGGADDCVSSNRWHGGSYPHRSRKIAEEAGHQGRQVWRVKKQEKENGTKRVTFAVPLVTELKPRKQAIPDDSIQFVKESIIVGAETVVEQEVNMEPQFATGEQQDTVMVHLQETLNIDNEVIHKEQLQPMLMVTPEEGHKGTDQTNIETSIEGHEDGKEDGKEQQLMMGEQLGKVLDHLQDLMHFARPVEKKKMDAIQFLIEQDAELKKKKDSKPKTVREAPSLLA